MGRETIKGTETFKIKLVKESVTINGIEVEDVSYHYFNVQNFFPIMEESEIKSGQKKEW